MVLGGGTGRRAGDRIRHQFTGGPPTPLSIAAHLPPMLENPRNTQGCPPTILPSPHQHRLTKSKLPH